MITKEQADELMKVPGRVKGVVLQTDGTYVKSKWGQEGLDKVKEELKKLGYPIEYEKAKAMEWIPLGYRPLSLLVIKDIFNLSDEDIWTMGNTAPKLSFMVKMMMKFFVTPKMTIEKSPGFWKQHYDAGRLDTQYLDKENSALGILSNIKMHPIVCKYLEGYFQRVMEYTLGSKVKCEEEKCMFKGDETHQYRWKW